MPAFTVIDHTEIGSRGAASWTKSSIPSTYDHLLIKGSVRTAASYNSTYLKFQVGNSGIDTGTNYSETYLYAGASPASSRLTSQSQIKYTLIPGATATSNTFGSLSIWIPHYANTANYKQFVMDSVAENNVTTPALSLVAGLWQSTSAITDLKLVQWAGSNLDQYSTITLYGITNNA